MGNLIHRGKGSFTHVENTVFFDRMLSLKAKGIYCQIRSLESNPEWVFTVAGFAALVSDGLASVKSGLKELEQSGYIIRARMRGENGRFASSEESLWVTLDDPEMYEDEVKSLESEGFSVLSKYRGRGVKGAPSPESATETKPEGDQIPEKPQMETRSRFSTCGESTCGEPTCGQSDAINPLGDESLNESKNPSLAPPRRRAGARPAPKPKRTGEFPEEFEELCDASLKPVVAISFKRDCFEAWNARVKEGYTPSQILRAYRSYAHGYETRNGSDNSKAKNLASWLTREGGLVDVADDPERCMATNDDGSPLSMEDLAERFKRFGRLWRKAKARRGLVASELNCENPGFSMEDLKAELDEDRQYGDYMDACRIAYDDYLRLVDPNNFYGLRSEDAPLEGIPLKELMARKEEINAIANDDPGFAELLDRYQTLSRDTTTSRLIGQLDDKGWERRRYEELELQHEIEERVRQHRESR